jgi:hypothetical protein
VIDAGIFNFVTSYRNFSIRPWIFRFSNRIEFRSFGGSRRITDKTDTQKMQEMVRLKLIVGFF